MKTKSKRRHPRKVSAYEIKIENLHEAAASSKAPPILNGKQIVVKYESQENWWDQPDDIQRPLVTPNVVTSNASSNEYATAQTLKQEPSNDIDTSVSTEHTLRETIDDENEGTCASESQESDKDSDKRKFKCDECQKEFASLGNLKRHTLTVHNGEKPYKCEKCNSKFGQMHHLHRHMRYHTGDKPFKCSQCNKGFAQQSDLGRHILVHTGEKPFTCDICHKLFRHMGNLRQHRRVHTKDYSPFECRGCGARFKKSINFYNHMRTVHEMMI